MRLLSTILLLLAIACASVLPDPRHGGDERDCQAMCWTLLYLQCVPWWPQDTDCVTWCVEVERDRPYSSCVRPSSSRTCLTARSCSWRIRSRDKA